MENKPSPTQINFDALFSNLGKLMSTDLKGLKSVDEVFNFAKDFARDNFDNMSTKTNTESSNERVQESSTNNNDSDSDSDKSPVDNESSNKPMDNVPFDKMGKIFTSMMNTVTSHSTEFNNASSKSNNVDDMFNMFTKIVVDMGAKPEDVKNISEVTNIMKNSVNVMSDKIKNHLDNTNDNIDKTVDPVTPLKQSESSDLENEENMKKIPEVAGIMLDSFISMTDEINHTGGALKMDHSLDSVSTPACTDVCTRD